MSVMFGFHRKPNLLATIRKVCVACQDRCAQELFSVRSMFRLLFVPAMPLPTTYRMTCASCGTSRTLSAEQADLLLATAPHAAADSVTGSSAGA